MNADIPDASHLATGRWLGPVAAVAMAAALLSFWLTGFRLLGAYRQTMYLTEGGSATMLAESALRRLTPDQRLVLVSDAKGRSALERAQALWARWPINRVYFHNALTVALVNYAALGDTDAARYRALRTLVEKGRPLDPGNARLDWVLAAKKMDQSCSFKSVLGEATAKHGATVRSEFVVSDRAGLLDDAMRLLTAGLAKTTYRRYGRELMAEREALLGPPRDLPQIVQRLAVAAGTSLPDVTVQRNLARGATAYATLLLAEGHTNAATVYLNAWKPLALRLNEDAFTLIDEVMVGAILKEAEVKVPELMRTVRGQAEETRVRSEIAALTRPLRDWKARRDKAEGDPAMAKRLTDCRDRSGLLLGMLLPALGEAPTAEAIRPSRMMDYLLLDHACLAGVAALLTIGLLVAAVVGPLAARRTGCAGPTVSEAWHRAVPAVVWGVALPVVVYLGVTWLTPMGGRGLGLQRAWPKAVMQAGILAAVVVLSLHRRIIRWARGDDQATGEDGIARIARTGRRIRVWTLAVLGAISLFPVAWLYTTETWGAILGLAPLVLLAMSALVGLGLAAWTWRSGAARRAEGVARAAAPTVLVLALAVFVLNLGARPLLLVEERRLAARETLIQVDAEIGGFTVVEARVARDIRDGVLQAAAMLGRR